MSLILNFSLISTFLGALFAFCPKDASLGSSGQCYFSIIYNETFNSAEHFCVNYFNGHLASVLNAFDNNVVTNMVRTNLPNAANVWLGGVYDGEKITWNDGSPDTYQHFGKGTEPGDILINLSTGWWETSSWNANLPFICILRDAPLTSIAPTLPAPTESCLPPCPTDWTYSSEFKSCYKTIYNVNFMNAEEQCLSMNSQLASIHSEAENEFAIALTKVGQDVAKLVDDPFVLIGGKRTGLDPKDWIWLDGTPFTYTNWADGQPDNSEGNEYCLMILADSTSNIKQPTNAYLWKWNDASCSDQYRIALCKQPAKY